ncbi:MAG: hypothetical protein ACE5LH_01345 [Fidelibacterota bacterium]
MSRRKEAGAGPEEKKPKKKKRPSFLDEVIAALLLIAIGSLVVWYLSLRWTVKSQVEEFTPEEFRLEREMDTGP